MKRLIHLKEQIYQVVYWIVVQEVRVLEGVDK